jgi:hypothetical protein
MPGALTSNFLLYIAQIFSMQTYPKPKTLL